MTLMHEIERKIINRQFNLSQVPVITARDQFFEN